MRRYAIPHTDLEVSRLAYGCMNIGGSWDDASPTEDEIQSATAAVTAARDVGINLFDHADIYARGKSELIFGEILRRHPGLRDEIILQSKCGIRFAGDPTPDAPARYDFSRDHIERSVEGILRRLGIERLDILLLHRPDPLVEPEEVAAAFDSLRSSGKVRYFGVSNHDSGQIELLRAALDQPLVINQIELGLLHRYPIEAGILINQRTDFVARAGGIIDYCRRHDILVQAWSPVAGGLLFNPPDDAPPEITRTAALVRALAERHETSREAIVLGWLLRHPAPIQPVVGTTRPERVRSSALADAVELTREEWYALLTAARGAGVP